MQKNGKVMFDNKTESEAKKEILGLVKKYCDTYHNQKKEFEPWETVSLMRLVYMTVKKCVIW